MKPYRPSGRIPFGGLIALILVTIIGSLVIGGLVFAISHVIYLIVLFPFIIGFLGGGLLTLVVKSTKVRSPIVAALFGLILGVGIMGVNRFAEYYIDFRNTVYDEISAEVGEEVPREEVDAFIDETLQAETGSSGFIGYIKYSASQGTTITRTTGSTDMTLDETATWIYWAAELLLIVGIIAVMGYRAAREPFNEEAGEWYPAGTWLGSVDWKSRKDFYKLLKNSDTMNAFKMVTTQQLTAPRVDVFVRRTPSTPDSDVILDIKEIRMNRRRELPANKMKGVLSASELSTLTRLTSGQLVAPVVTSQPTRAAEGFE